MERKIFIRLETAMLQIIAMKMTNNEITQKLFAAIWTIDTNRQNLIKKLQVKNTIGLIKAAYKLNLIDE